MYTPRAFAEHDPRALDGLLQQNPFVTLVTRDAEGLPFASHLPVLFRREGERLLIEGHWADPNPQAAHDPAALMIVHGPHAYISPGWYVDKHEAGRVPTWNYAVAHLHGRLQSSTDPDVLASVVARLSRRFEQEIGSDWAYGPEHAPLLRGIVAFSFEPGRIELKFKLNQNHPAANVEAAAEGLERAGGEQRLALARLMRERLARRNHGSD